MINQLKFLENIRDSEVVVVEVLKTSGSVYQMPGAMKIVGLDGTSVGLISGGCLEGHIVKLALQVRENIVHKVSTEGEYDKFYGYELGCRGQLTLGFSRKSVRVVK